MKHEKGVILVTALIFLLILTILGVSSMSGTVLEERMAGNQADRNMAFQAAESALRDANEWLAAQITYVEASDTGARHGREDQAFAVYCQRGTAGRRRKTVGGGGNLQRHHRSHAG